MTTTGTDAAETAVLEVSGVYWATEKAVVEAVLGRRPGVLEVEANPVAQTATVIYDPARTSVAELAGWIRDCGYHCAGPVRAPPRLRPAARGPPSTPADPALRRHHAEHGHLPPATAGRRDVAARDDGPRRARRGMSMDGDGRATCATGSWSPRCSRSRSCCGPRSAATCSASRCRRRSGYATTCSR